MISAKTSQHDPQDPQLTASRFSLLKIASIIAGVLAIGLVAAGVFVFANPAKKTNPASVKPLNEDTKSRLTAISSNSGSIGYGTRSDTKTSSGPTGDVSVATDAGVSKFGAVRQFFFGTRTRKIVSSAAVGVLVLLVAFVILYFTVLSRPDAGAANPDNGPGSSDQPPQPLTQQQQAELEVNHMIATDPTKFYGLVYGVPSAIVAVVLGPIIASCFKVRVSNATGLSEFFTKGRLAAVLFCLVVVLAFIAIPLGLYFGDSQASWLIVYAMVHASPAFPMVLAYVLLALGAIALVSLCFFIWRIGITGAQLDYGMVHQFMSYTNHAGYDAGTHKFMPKAKRAIIIKLIFLVVSIAGCCLGLAYGLAHMDDVPILCATTIPCVGVFILSVVVLFWNRIFLSATSCTPLVENCGGLALADYQNI